MHILTIIKMTTELLKDCYNKNNSDNKTACIINERYTHDNEIMIMKLHRCDMKSKVTM